MADTLHLIDSTESNLHEETGEHDEAFVSALLLIPFCLIIGNLTRHICIEFGVPLPYTVILLLLGMWMGSLEAVTDLSIMGESIFSVKHISPHLLLGAFIPPLIFESAFATEWHVIRRQFGQALMLAFPGVILNTIITAIFCVYVFPYDWYWAEAITFGSIVSATDPVAVVAILRELGASKRLATLIEGESLLNDGSAFVLYQIALQFVKGEAPTGIEVIRHFCQLTFGGIAIGIAFGIVSVIWLRLVFNDERIEIIITVTSCFMAYWVCENEVHASGVLGVVFLGLTLSKYKSAISPMVAESMEHFWEVFSYIMNTLIFIFGGIIVVLGVFNDEVEIIKLEDIGWNFLLYIILHVARAITVVFLWWFLRNMGYGITWKEATVLIIAGLRGVIALSLGLMTKLENFNEDFKDLVMFHTSGIVFWTLILNGTLIKYIVKGLGLTKPSEHAQLILMDTMKHLRQSTKTKIYGMKGNPSFSGANWEEVNRSLPSYAHILGEKDTREIIESNNWCNCLQKRAKHRKMNSSDTRYEEIHNKPEYKHQISNELAMNGKANESNMHLTRFGFGIDDTFKRRVSTITEEERKDGIENGEDTKEETEETTRALCLNEIDSNEEFVYSDIVNDAENDFVTKYQAQSIPQYEEKEDSVDKKECDLWNEAHVHNTIKLILQRSDNYDDVIGESEGCKKQIKHRVLLILKRAYHETFEEGIISLDSYMILEDAISAALDSDNLDELHKSIMKSLKLNIFVRWLYNKYRSSISQYLLMKQLMTAIEVGMVFTATFEVLNDKLNVIPSISESPLLIDIMNYLKTSVFQIKQEWLALHEMYPEIYNSIQTRHAVQTIIHYEATDIFELFKRGLFDESEFTKMTAALLKTEHKLYFSTFYYVSSISSSEHDKKQTLLSTIFISKLQKHTATYQDKINYLLKKFESNIYNKDDIIIKRNEKCSPKGIYVLLSGTASLIIHRNTFYNDDDDDEPNLIRVDTEMEMRKQNGNNNINELYLTKGSIIGGYAYLTGKRYLNTCIAKTASDVFFIDDKIIKYLLKNEKKSFIFLWRQIATNIMLTQFWRNNTSFFAFYNETDINIMCQQSTFKHFKSADKNKRKLLLNDQYMALLLDGDAYYYINDNISKQSRFNRKIFNSPCILLSYHKTYTITINGKIIIFDHHPNTQKKGASSLLSPTRRQKLRR